MKFNDATLLAIFLILNWLSKVSPQQPPNCNITQWGGPSRPGQACQFPFNFLGKKFDRCTTASEGDSRPWCPTELSEDRVYRFGSRAWGYCDPGCPFQDSQGNYRDTTTPKPELRKNRPPVVFTTEDPNKFIPDIFIPSSTTPKVDLDSSEYEETNPDSLSGTWLPRHALGECGLSLDTGFIIGGSQANRGEFPFIALLGYKGQNGRIVYKCGGSLINRRYIITAAHCHLPPRLQIVEIRLAEFDLATDPDCKFCKKAQVFFPEAIVSHPKWRSSRATSGEGDIALIRLDRPVMTINENIDEVVMPICLPESPAAESMRNVMTAGWGKITNEDLANIKDFKELGVSTRTLQKLKLPLVNQDVCRAYFPNINENHLCAGGEAGKDSCNGDSGGPLVARRNSDAPMNLIGVVSSGTRICGKGQPGIYTRVINYISWIKNNIKP